VDGLIERVAGVLGVVLGPEAGEETVSRMKPARLAERQIDQKRDALRLREHRAEVLSFGVLKCQRSERAQADHTRFTQSIDRSRTGNKCELTPH
jgi:hypothetical protein